MGFKIGKTAWGILVVLVVVGIAWYTGMLEKIMPGLKTTASQTLEKSNIQKVVVEEKSSQASSVTMPSNTPVQSSEPTTVRVAAWNSQFAWLFANGGVTTTEGSLMAKNGINLTFDRNDDYGQMQQGLMAHARACARGNFFSGEGVTFAAFMGDGAPSFLQGLNPLLEKELGPEYIAEGFAVAGWSFGEDQWLVPPSWKQNPQLARGSLTIVVLRDGDFNICLKWASDNGIPVNPDPTTYDPDALNFAAANSFTQAAQLFIAGVTETRPVVKGGKRTGEEKTITAQAVSTWTPGDQQVVDQKGGVITMANTRDYAGQMPCLIVGIKAFNKRYPNIPTGMIRAIDEGAKAIRSSSQARMRAAEISSAVYKENEPGYWYKYFNTDRRTVVIDGTQYVVTLGGSRVATIADNLAYFGQAPGSRNIFKDTYDYFGKQYMKLYPEYLPSYPPFEQVINLTYLNQAKIQTGSQAPAAMAQFQQGAEVTQVVGRKSWNVEFEFGSARLTPQAEVTLEQMAGELTMGYELRIALGGHTDSIGTEFANQSLSEARARAVRDWLYQKYPYNFPLNRMEAIGYGESKPVADNSTAEGRARNRRVEIVVGR